MNPKVFPVYKNVTDLGAAAYLMMHKYSVAGKKGKSIYFEIHSQEENDEFDQLYMKYLNSEFHRFDTCLLSLKKIGEFMPEGA